MDVVDVVERAGESLFYLRMDSLCRACMGGVVLEYAQIVVKEGDLLAMGGGML